MIIVQPWSSEGLDNAAGRLAAALVASQRGMDAESAAALFWRVRSALAEGDRAEPVAAR